MPNPRRPTRYQGEQVMPTPLLKPEYEALTCEMIDTMTAGLHEWRSDLNYPESHSDWQGCVRALLRRFDVKRRPIDVPPSTFIREDQRCDKECCR